MLTAEQLDQILAVAQRYGVTRLKLDGLEFNLLPAQGPLTPTTNHVSKEDMLFWSAPDPVVPTPTEGQ
jgi:hypothetical protein